MEKTVDIIINDFNHFKEPSYFHLWNFPKKIVTKLTMLKNRKQLVKLFDFFFSIRTMHFNYSIPYFDQLVIEMLISLDITWDYWSEKTYVDTRIGVIPRTHMTEEMPVSLYFVNSNNPSRSVMGKDLDTLDFLVQYVKDKNIVSNFIFNLFKSLTYHRFSNSSSEHPDLDGYKVIQFLKELDTSKYPFIVEYLVNILNLSKFRLPDDDFLCFSIVPYLYCSSDYKGRDRIKKYVSFNLKAPSSLGSIFLDGGIPL
jgi:hypothetical protein